MALGSATVITANQLQGPVTAVEKYFLFVGVISDWTGALNTTELNGYGDGSGIVFLNTDSDLDAELGEGESDLKTQIAAARNNAGPGWACVAAPIETADGWAAAVDMAMAVLPQGVGVEAIVICPDIDAGADLTAYQTKAESILSTYGRYVFIMASARAIDGDPVDGESWGQYTTALAALTNGIAADRVLLVPRIFPDSLGILAGRLCNYQTSIADTPMRVATGAVIGRDMSTFPVDKNDIPYNNAHALTLNQARYSVPQVYPDYPGVYWSDGAVLDVPGGDFAVIENRRVADKAARRVRMILIGMVGNRQLNDTPEGEAWAILKLMKPLRDMSANYLFQGIPFPADIQDPVDGDIAIQWTTRTTVNIYMKVRPHHIPKELRCFIVLDLST